MPRDLATRIFAIQDKITLLSHVTLFIVNITVNYLASIYPLFPPIIYYKKKKKKTEPCLAHMEKSRSRRGYLSTRQALLLQIRKGVLAFKQSYAMDIRQCPLFGQKGQDWILSSGRRLRRRFNLLIQMGERKSMDLHLPVIVKIIRRGNPRGNKRRQ